MFIEEIQWKICLEKLNNAIKINNIEEFNICLKSELLDIDDRINIPNEKTGNTPLLYACQFNNLYMASKLLKKGADINKQNIFNGNTPLLYICNWSFLDIGFDLNFVLELLQNGAIESINVKNKLGRTPLIYACKSKNKDLIILLLKHGAYKTINDQENDGNTALSHICHYLDIDVYIDIISLLLQNGAKKSIKLLNIKGESPFKIVFLRKNFKIISLLLSYDITYNIFELLEIHNNKYNEKEKEILLLIYVYYNYNNYNEIHEEIKIQFIIINKTLIDQLFNIKQIQKEEYKIINSSSSDLRMPLLLYANRLAERSSIRSNNNSSRTNVIKRKIWLMHISSYLGETQIFNFPIDIIKDI